MDKLPSSIKIIALVFFTIAIFFSILWVLSEPYEYEPWATLFSFLGGWLIDSVLILNALGLIKTTTEGNSEVAAQGKKSLGIPTYPRQSQAGSVPLAQPYYHVAVVLISGISSVTSLVVFLEVLSQEFLVSEFVFYVFLLPGLLGAVALALLTDIFEMKEYSAWQRFPLAMILGGIGTFLGLIIVPIIIIAVFLWGINRIDSYTTNRKPYIDNEQTEKSTEKSVPQKPLFREKPSIRNNPFDINQIPKIKSLQDKRTDTWQQMPYSVQCALCEGKGKYLLNKVCTACGGQGTIRVHFPPKKCTLCRGTGTKNRLTREPCLACNGTGWVHTNRK